MVSGGNVIVYNKILKNFYALADVPTVFQVNVDDTLKSKHLPRLEDIFVVTNEGKQKHEKDLIETLAKIEKKTDTG